MPATRRLLINHVEEVTAKAVAVAERLTRAGRCTPDVVLVREAAMLHDIGIGLTRAPSLGCSGEHPYICHGYLGRQLLESEGLPVHAMICERHVGVGISRNDIRQQRLPLPLRDMVPQTIEEQIVCYADSFYSKNGRKGCSEKAIAEILAELRPYGPDKVKRFKGWLERFEA